MGNNGLPECDSAVGHEWQTIQVDAAGYGSIGTYVYEECTHCHIIRLNRDRDGDVYALNTSTGDYERVGQ